uniref:Uncharacterized protein n=1 Tax=Aegilops tauschii subsp. strangulata TaxID=200361 RepID=A0A453TA11_AEGTS
LSCPISHSSRGSSRCHLRRLIQATTGESRHREAQPELPSHRGALPSGYIQHSRPPKPTRDPPPMARVSGIFSSPMALSSSSRPVSGSPPLASSSLSPLFSNLCSSLLL